MADHQENKSMTILPHRFGLLRAATAAAALLLIPAAATAGQCPAGKSGVDVRPMNATPAKDVTDVVITTIDVASEPSAIANRSFRLRKLVVQPGGVVPWHSHGDRPAIIYIVSGEITEFASNCSVPIVHKAGDATPELHQTSHWWKNESSKPAVLLSSDLLKTGDDAKMM
jgi:quercetin dioxygenase-like cupin family protein